MNRIRNRKKSNPRKTVLFTILLILTLILIFNMDGIIANLFQK